MVARLQKATGRLGSDAWSALGAFPTTGSCCFPSGPCCAPLAVRSYQRGSEICERFAQSLHHLTAIEERELFDFGRWGVIPSL